MFVLEVPGSARIFKKDASSVQRDLEMSPRSQSFWSSRYWSRNSLSGSVPGSLIRGGGWGKRGEDTINIRNKEVSNATRKIPDKKPFRPMTSLLTVFKYFLSKYIWQLLVKLLDGICDMEIKKINLDSIVFQAHNQYEANQCKFPSHFFIFFFIFVVFVWRGKWNTAKSLPSKTLLHPWLCG